MHNMSGSGQFLQSEAASTISYPDIAKLRYMIINLLSGEGSVQVVGDLTAVEESTGQEESPIGAIPKENKRKACEIRKCDAL